MRIHPIYDGKHGKSFKSGDLGDMAYVTNR
jgi:hypothetical protein